MKYTENTLINTKIENIVEYLSKYIDVTEIKKKYQNCEYNVIDENKIKVNIYNTCQVIDFEGRSGMVATPIVFQDGKFRIVSPKCFIRKTMLLNENYEHTIFHELMHVGSTKQTLKSDMKYIINSGIKEESIRILFSVKEKTNDADFLNEALTELVSKMIYDDLYNDKYIIREKNGDLIIQTTSSKAYFLLAFLLLNYFEKNKEILFDIYFNNNIKLLDKVLKKECNFSLKKLIKLTNSYKEYNFISETMYKQFIDTLDEKNRLLNEDVRKQYNL